MPDTNFQNPERAQHTPRNGICTNERPRRQFVSEARALTTFPPCSRSVFSAFVLLQRAKKRMKFLVHRWMLKLERSHYLSRNKSYMCSRIQLVPTPYKEYKIDLDQRDAYRTLSSFLLGLFFIERSMHDIFVPDLHFMGDEVDILVPNRHFGQLLFTGQLFSCLLNLSST